MFAIRCARLVLLGGLAAACTDTTNVVAPMDAAPLGPSFATFALPDAGYLAQTTKIDISGLTPNAVIPSISDGTQTMEFSTGLLAGVFNAPWGVPPAVEVAAGVPVLVSLTGAPFSIFLSRPSAIVGFELSTFPFPGGLTEVLFASNGTIVEQIIQDAPLERALLFAASTNEPIDAIVVRPAAGNLQVYMAQFRYGDNIELSATVDGSTTVNPKTGVAVVSGTITCSVPVTVPISVSLQQQQKAKRVPTTVQASGTTSVACTGTSVWSMALAPSSGGFVNGDASASLTAGVGLIDPPVATTKAVKLYWGHK